MFEVREVLRLWLEGRSYRSIASLVRPDRKTVTRVVEAAVGLGLDRAGGVAQLDDVFVGLVMSAIRQDRPDRHGESWALLSGRHADLAGWVDKGVPVRKMVELLARSGTVAAERTVNRYVAEKFPKPAISTVRVADGVPGSELQVDFGELGVMLDEESGRAGGPPTQLNLVEYYRRPTVQSRMVLIPSVALLSKPAPPPMPGNQVTSHSRGDRV